MILFYFYHFDFEIGITNLDRGNFGVTEVLYHPHELIIAPTSLVLIPQLVSKQIFYYLCLELTPNAFAKF